MILCFGEILLRLQPNFAQRQAALFVGGAEANVAASLANWQHPVQYATALPNNDIAHYIIENLSNLKIDTTKIERNGDRVGVYYLIEGTDIKSGVTYDRKYSSFDQWSSHRIDWDQMLEGVTWLHWSAITPAINEQWAQQLSIALPLAKQKGITISVDLNYRAKLWQYGKAPQQIMPNLVQYADVIMGNMWAVEALLGIASPIVSSNGVSKDALVNAAKENMQTLQTAYPNAKHIGYTFRLADSYFGAYLHNELVLSKHFDIKNVIDKVGTGDSFMAGLIHGISEDYAAQEIINFAAAAAVSKLQVPGDFNTNSKEAIYTYYK